MKREEEVEATGFKGTSIIFGRKRRVEYDGEAEGRFTVNDLSLDEAQMLVKVLEAVGMKQQAQPQTAPTREPTPRTRSPRDSDKTGPNGASQTTEGEVAAAAEAKRAEVQRQREAEAKKRAEAKAQAEAEARAKAEAEKKKAAKAKAAAEAKKKAAAAKKAAEEAAAAAAAAESDDDDDMPPHDPVTGEVIEDDDEETEIEREAREEREAIQAIENESDDDETPSAAGAVDFDTDNVPETIMKARHLRTIISELWEMGMTDTDDIVTYCQAVMEKVPVLKRTGKKIPERVQRAMEVMQR